MLTRTEIIDRLCWEVSNMPEHDRWKLANRVRYEQNLWDYQPSIYEMALLLGRERKELE